MESNNQAIFFLSTGRCGTQWLSRALTDVLSDVAYVTHEPLRSEYNPKKYLRSGITEKADLPKKIRNHLDEIHRVLEDRHYIETGWPWFGVAPVIINEFPSVKIVHLVRHPVRVAISLAAQKAYDSKHPYFPLAHIDPFDSGTIDKNLTDSWDSLSVYEKCLYWWTEINLYAEELKITLPNDTFHFLRSEDMFDSESRFLNELFAFMGIEYRPTIETWKAERVDHYSAKTFPTDWRKIQEYPVTLELARSYGYEFDDALTTSIRERYIYSFSQQLKERMKPFAKRILGRR